MSEDAFDCGVMNAVQTISFIATVARVTSAQAGTGGMETAGSIVSFLAANPQFIDGFLAGGSILDWPFAWHRNGCLSWHGVDGEIHWPGEMEVKQ